MQGKFVTIRFLNFTGFQAKRHAFAEMGRSLVQCWSAPGLLFAKHLGTGAGNGFSILPNFGLYAWLGVWESPQKAEELGISTPGPPLFILCIAPQIAFATCGPTSP